MRRRRSLGLLLLLAAAAACRQAAPAPSRPNVLVVTIDTIRADHVGAYGSASGATPSIDALAREGILFEQAIAAAPLTLPSHTAIFSGLLPFRTGVRVNGTDRVAESVPLLAEAFFDRGYRTGAFVSSLVLRQGTGIGRGFDTYDDRFAANAGRDPRDLAPERRGEETIGRALAWLSSAPSGKSASAVPYFAWVHLYDPHAPYEPPAPYAARFQGREYDGEIAYADTCLARLLAAVDGKTTLVVLAGDHGESLGEHGEETHGVFLYDSTIRVPLLLRLPGQSFSGVRVATQVRLTDLAPTIRAAAGLPAVESDGEDLSALFRAPRSPDRPALSEADYSAFVLGWSPLRSLRLSGRKYIDAPRRELYELRGDPGERDNRYSGADGVRDLARPLVQTLARKPLAEATSSAVDPEVARRLASLGYISGGAAVVDYGRIDPSRVDPKEHIAVWSVIESGLIARQKKNYEAAVTIFERLTASYPTINPVILRDYAQACRFTGRLDRSIALYEKVLKTATPEPDDFFGLGVAWHLKGDESKATGHFERAVAMNPGDLASWIDLGNGRLALGDLGAAEQAFLKAAGLDAKSVDAISGLASVAFEKKDYRSAAEILRRALALAPEDPQTLFNLAIVEKRSGRADAAGQIYAGLARSADPAVAARARKELQGLR